MNEDEIKGIVNKTLDERKSKTIHKFYKDPEKVKSAIIILVYVSIVAFFSLGIVFFISSNWQDSYFEKKADLKEANERIDRLIENNEFVRESLSDTRDLHKQTLSFMNCEALKVILLDPDYDYFIYDIQAFILARC